VLLPVCFSMPWILVKVLLMFVSPYKYEYSATACLCQTSIRDFLLNPRNYAVLS